MKSEVQLVPAVLAQLGLKVEIKTTTNQSQKNINMAGANHDLSPDELHFHYNNDIWFIDSSQVVEILAIMDHLYISHESNPVWCRYEARKICAMYFHLPTDCVEQIDREYQLYGTIIVNWKMDETDTIYYYKIIFKNDCPHLTPDIEQAEEKDKQSGKFSEEDLQEAAKNLKKSDFSEFINQHGSQCLDFRNLCLETGSRKRRSFVCMSNYIIKVWNYSANRGLNFAEIMTKHMFGMCAYIETFEILHSQLIHHGLFEEGWKRFERYLLPRDDKGKLLTICFENRISLPFKTTHDSYELDQSTVPKFWDMVFSHMYKDKDELWKSKNQHFMDFDLVCLILSDQIIEILAIMEYLSLTKSNWCITDRIIVCALHQQINAVYIAQLHNEFLSKKKIEMSSYFESFGRPGKVLVFINGANLCSRSPSHFHLEVTPDEHMNAADTLKWSSYADLTSKYNDVSIEHTYYIVKSSNVFFSDHDGNNTYR